jgi:hypothetical protein
MLFDLHRPLQLETRVQAVTYRQESPLIYYVVLFVGMALFAAYFWVILTAAVVYTLFHYALYVSGLLLGASTFLLAFANTRSARTGLTALSGMAAGIHSYLLLTLFSQGGSGIILFAWMAAGLLFGFAAFAWLRERY